MEIKIPTKNKLLDIESDRQKVSDILLDELNIVPTLSKYGEVRILGAKEMGLMIARDIDISVVFEDIPAISLWKEAISSFLTTPGIRKVTAMDYYNYDNQRNYDPQNGEKFSYYISMDRVIDSEKNRWEIQIHFMSESKLDFTLANKVKENLNEENRYTILKIKYWANEFNKKYKLATNGDSKIDSVSIYKAVIDENINSIEEFINYFMFKLEDDKKIVFMNLINEK